MIEHIQSKDGNIIIDRIKDLAITFSDGSTVIIDQVIDYNMSIRKDDKSMIRITNNLYDKYLAEKLYRGLDVINIQVSYYNVDLVNYDDVKINDLNFKCNMIVSTYDIKMNRDEQGISIILIGSLEPKKY